MDGSWVCSMMVRMQLFARDVNSLLVRPHKPSNVGTNSDTRGSNDEPRPTASADTRSTAVPDRRLRSEFIALFRGLESERMPDTMSDAWSHPPLWQMVIKEERPSVITSQESSVSVRVTFLRMTSNSALRAAGELHVAPMDICWSDGELRGPRDREWVCDIYYIRSEAVTL